MDSYIFDSCLTVNFPAITWRQDLLIPTPRLLFPYNERNFCSELTGLDTNICLSWYPVAEATTYLLQWSFNPDFQGPSVQEQVINAPSTIHCFTAPFQIRQGQQIYWRVFAANLTTGGVSNESEVRSFTYNCNSNTNKPDSCDAYAVKIGIKGPDHLDSCDVSNYSAEVSRNCVEDQTSENYFQVKESFWTLSINGSNLSTQTGESNEFEGTLITQEVDNPNLLCLTTNDLPTQIVKLCHKVVFEFPNDVLRPNFECEGCSTIFIKDDKNTGPKPLILSKSSKSQDNDELRVPLDKMDLPASQYIRGEVFEAPDCNPWPCKCACLRKSRLSVNGVLIRDSGILQENLPATNCCCDDVGDAFASINQISLDSNCNSFDFTIFYNGGCDPTRVLNGTFSCCDREIDTITATDHLNAQVTIPNDFSPVVTNPSLLCDAGACLDVSVSLNLLSDPTFGPNCTTAATIRATIECNGGPFNTVVDTVFELTQSELSSGSITKPLNLSFGVDCEYSTEITFNAKDALDTIEFLDVECDPVVVKKVEGTYTLLEATDPLPAPACECAPSLIEVTITVDEKSAKEVFELSGETYLPLAELKLEEDGVVYNLASIWFDIFNNCNMLATSSLPNNLQTILTVDNCDADTGQFRASGAIGPMAIAITENNSCNGSPKRLETRTPFSTDCSLKAGDRGLGIDHLALVGGGSLVAYSGSPAKDDPLTPEVCNFIDLPVCTCLDCVTLYSNSTHTAIAKEDISPESEGLVYFKGIAACEVLANNKCQVQITEGDEVLVHVTDDCQYLIRTCPVSGEDKICDTLSGVPFYASSSYCGTVASTPIPAGATGTVNFILDGNPYSINAQNYGAYTAPAGSSVILHLTEECVWKFNYSSQFKNYERPCQIVPFGTGPTAIDIPIYPNESYAGVVLDNTIQPEATGAVTVLVYSEELSAVVSVVIQATSFCNCILQAGDEVIAHVTDDCQVFIFCMELCSLEARIPGDEINTQTIMVPKGTYHGRVTPDFIDVGEEGWIEFEYPEGTLHEVKFRLNSGVYACFDDRVIAHVTETCDLWFDNPDTPVECEEISGGIGPSIKPVFTFYQNTSYLGTTEATVPIGQQGSVIVNTPEGDFPIIGTNLGPDECETGTTVVFHVLDDCQKVFRCFSDLLVFAQAPSGGIPARTLATPGSATCKLLEVATTAGTSYAVGDLINTGVDVTVKNWAFDVAAADGDRVLQISKASSPAFVVGWSCNNVGTPTDIKDKE